MKFLRINVSVNLINLMLLEVLKVKYYLCPTLVHYCINKYINFDNNLMSMDYIH